MAQSGPHVQKALKSSAWLLGERGLILLLNFLVGILLARYLGPDQLGSLSYAIAFIGLLSTIPYLGFAGVVVQQLIQQPQSRDKIMGAVLWSKLAAAVLAFLLGNAIAQFIVDDVRERLLVLLISASMLFDVATSLRLHFEARTESRSIVVVSSLSGIAAAIARLGAIVVEAPLWVFAAIISAQSALAAIGYLAIYERRTGASALLRFNFVEARNLLAKSWPLILSSAMATIYLKIDQFMLGQMRDMASVGTYAVAARISEIWYLIPAAVSTSMFPRLVELKKSDSARYESRIRESLRYLFWLSLLIAIPVSLAAPLIITRLYGEAFREAGVILAIHIWACPAVFMGTALQKWFIAEGLLKYLIRRQLMSAAVNVGLNLLLIPRYGGIGAAVATVAAYTLAYYLSCFTSRRTAPGGWWMTEAMLWPLLRFISRVRASST